MRLAGFLKMRLEDIFENMSSREFAYWQAWNQYYEPVGGDWHRAGLVAAATLAPYCPRGSTPKPRDFIPVMKPPQHPVQMLEELAKIKQDLGK